MRRSTQPLSATGRRMLPWLAWAAIAAAFQPVTATAEGPERVQAAYPPWQLPPAFSLGRCVPHDASLYVHWAPNPERAGLRPQIEAFWRAVWKAGVHEDLKRMLLPRLVQDPTPATDKAWRRAMEAFDRVHWASMTRGQVLLVGRMKGLTPELLLLFEDDAKTVEADAKALGECLEALAGLSEGMQTIPLEVHGSSTTILTSVEAATCLQLMRRHRLIALCYGPRPPELLDDVLGLIAGKSKRQQLINSPRFKRIMTALPRPEDRLAYADIALAVRQSQQAGVTPVKPTSSPQGLPGRGRVLRRLARLLGVYDYWAAVDWTEDRRQERQSTLALGAAGNGTGFWPAVAEQPLFEDAWRFIPYDAVGYWLCPGANPAVTYDVVLAALGSEADDPDAFMAEWNAIQEDLGFRLRADLLEWLDGRVMAIALPPTAEPNRSQSLVVMLGVRDAPAARAKLASLLEKLASGSAEGRPRLGFKPQNVRGVEGTFHGLAADPDDPVPGLVLGVARGWLFIATDPVGVTRCLAVAQGKAKSISTDALHKANGLAGPRAVAAASFVRFRHLDRDLGGWLGMAGLIGKALPDQPALDGTRALLSLLGRLRQPITTLDFLECSSSVTTFDGRQWKTRSLVTRKGGGS